MAADTHSPDFYGSAFLRATQTHSYSDTPGCYLSENPKNSFDSRMLIDGEPESLGLHGFQRSIGFLELSKVTQGLSIFGADAGARHRAGVALDAGQGEKRMDGILDILIHQAIGVQNICIYDDQDVYAKFSLTQSDAEALRTKIVKAVGRNPIFNQSLQIAVNQADPILKCEIWMASENRRYLEDQMLAFVLVPLAPLQGKGKHVQDHELVSTDLFHSPNGIVRLALTFHEHSSSPSPFADVRDNNPTPGAYNDPVNPSSFSNLNCDILNGDANVGTFNLGLGSVPRRLDMDGSVAHGGTLPTMVSRPSPNVFPKVEFPDMSLACESQQMVSDYLKLTSTDLTLVCPSEEDCYGKQAGAGSDRMVSYSQSSFPSGPFLQLGSFPASRSDYHSVVDSEERALKKGDCPDRDGPLSGLYNSSGMQALDDCRIFSTPAASPFESLSVADTSSFTRLHHEPSYSSPTNCIVNDSRSSSGAGNSTQGSPSPVSSSFFTSPLTTSSSRETTTLVNSTVVGERSQHNLSRQSVQSSSPMGFFDDIEVVQQEIVDLYTKSLQQFTESLAKMQIPLEVAKDVPPDWRDQQESVDARTRLPARVFYGSRAFF